MSEWLDSQQKPSGNFCKLLQERIEKTNPRRTLTAKESKRLSRLEGIIDKLRRGENVQNRQLQTCLSDDKYKQLASEWDTQKLFREELKDKPDELKRYEDKLKEAYIEAGTKHLTEAETVFSFGSIAVTLNYFLEKANAPSVIDFISLDVEGAELEVLKGINFEQFSFKYMLIELRDLERVESFLKNHNYVLEKQLSVHDYLFKYS